MNIFNLIPQTYSYLTLFLLLMTRISFVFSTFILFRRDYVNSKIIISLSAILAFYAVLIINNKPPQYEIASLNMMMNASFQALIGFMIGLVLNIIFEIFTAVGQIISTQIGLSVATLLDPRFGAITPLTIFYNYLAVIIFLMLNGHLLLIQFILDSFNTIPTNYIYIPFSRIEEIAIFANNIFLSSVSLSLTIIITMMLTNITIAVMSRFAPQFNIFTVGVNVTMIFGLIFVYLMFNYVVSNGEEIINSGMEFLGNILSGMK